MNMTTNDLTGTNNSLGKGASTGPFDTLHYEDLPLWLKSIITRALPLRHKFYNDLEQFYQMKPQERTNFKSDDSKHMFYIVKNYPTLRDFQKLINKWTQQHQDLKGKRVQEKQGPNKTQTKADNFNKNSKEFSKNPFQNQEPRSFTKQEPTLLIPDFDDEIKPIREQHSRSKVSPINHAKGQALKTIMNTDPNNLPPQRFPNDFNPALPSNSSSSSSSSSSSDDSESSEEEGLHPSEILPHRVIVSEHLPYGDFMLWIARTIYQTTGQYVEPFHWLIILFTFAKKIYNNESNLIHKRDIIIRYLISLLCTSFMKWLFKWLFNTFHFTYRCYLMKLKKKDKMNVRTKEEYKEIIRNERSLVRQPTQQMTERVEANFHYYEYSFYRRYHLGRLANTMNLVLMPAQKAINYLVNTNYNYEIPEMFETKITVNNWDFPEEFTKYTEFRTDEKLFSKTPHNTDQMIFKKQPKIEVVHSDLLHRIWNASTFNMMNGVEQLHSRISNVINSSNDFVMFSRESKNSAINGTKNLLCYLIQERFTNDPNKNFHRGSPEFSNTGIEFSIFNIGGDLRFLNHLRLISVLLIFLECADALRSLSRYKFHLEYMLEPSRNHTPIFSTLWVQLWARSRDLIQLSLFLVNLILKGGAVALSP